MAEVDIAPSFGGELKVSMSHDEENKYISVNEDQDGFKPVNAWVSLSLASALRDEHLRRLSPSAFIRDISGPG